MTMKRRETGNFQPAGHYGKPSTWRPGKTTTPLLQPANAFPYETAFSRNIGLVTRDQQQRLRQLRVGIAGLGGVGGAHLETLARLGVGAFHLADPDVFEPVNLNRQLGARRETFGRNKTAVMAETASAINPDTNIRHFRDGLHVRNLDAFLDGLDCVVDGLDFFALAIRRLVYRHCRERGIPVIMAGPIGFGAAVLVFTPKHMSFEEYFGYSEDMTRTEMLLAFYAGLCPTRQSDIRLDAIDLQGGKGPAVCSSCMLCAGLAGTELLKWVTGNGTLAHPGRGLYVDVMRQRCLRLRPVPSLKHTWRGRLIRHFGFKRIPGLHQLHKQDLLARQTTGERTGEQAS